jgi:hypothetical protein
MNPLRIKGIPSTWSRGDFGAVVRGSDLTLPQEVAETFVKHGVRNADDLVSYVQTFPSSIARDLQWDVTDVFHGLTRLRTQLSGYVADDVLNPPQRHAKGYGAMNPARLKDWLK